jgi:N-formylglutamate deformylase
MNVFTITASVAPRVPILLSSPHSGTAFPKDMQTTLKPELMADPYETDWFIPQLFDFVTDMGVTMISANYSRWLIDLNRNPTQQPLYNDGRIITALVPETDFNGNRLYSNETPGANEINFRLKNYHLPYHQKLAEILAELKAAFGYAILIDGHSIRRYVPGIQADPFPDITLSDNDGATASAQIISTVYETLLTDDYSVTHNHPFKGGHITRSVGNPQQNIHAMQLEIAKPNYMHNDEKTYHPGRADKLRNLLQKTFTNLINSLS